MHTNSSANRVVARPMAIAAVLVAVALFCAGECSAQVGGGGGGGLPPVGGPGGGGGGVPPVVGPIPDGGGVGVPGGDGGGAIPGAQDGGNQNLGGGGGTGNTADGAGDGQLESVDPFRIEFQVPDRRNQGFVGPTAERIQNQGFVGPPSENGGPALADEAFSTPGGNVNAGRGNRTAINSSVQLQQNGFVVQRQGIRARLVPSFSAPATPGFVAQSRFQSRIVRQPVVRQLGQGVNVSVADRTATMTGFVRSEAERQILRRQLRLEPGVYRIVDQTTVAN